ncbi:hypothetical protein NRB20_70000 [Nocardia sp. RB20]|uniref:Uncharacterized protein n=1 Tax=Nocardia macrotermitis TaxID=2585198 RepID=A0A7K0DDS9_9NOCA|nr:hypothetical protein [Nocardia macrotermitis]
MWCGRCGSRMVVGALSIKRVVLPGICCVRTVFGGERGWLRSCRRRTCCSKRVRGVWWFRIRFSGRRRSWALCIVPGWVRKGLCGMRSTVREHVRCGRSIAGWPLGCRSRTGRRACIPRPSGWWSIASRSCRWMPMPHSGETRVSTSCGIRGVDWPNYRLPMGIWRSTWRHADAGCLICFPRSGDPGITPSLAAATCVGAGVRPGEFVGGAEYGRG